MEVIGPREPLFCFHPAVPRHEYLHEKEYPSSPSQTVGLWTPCGVGLRKYEPGIPAF